MATTPKRHRTSTIGFILLSSLIMITWPCGSYANVNSPQGALDVASMLPGKYAFLDRSKRADAAATPTEAIETQEAPQIKAPEATEIKTSAVEPAAHASDARSMNIDTLIDLMRQATEASSVIQSMPESVKADAAPASADSVTRVLDVVAKVPARRAVDARALIKSRGLMWPVDGNIYSAFAASRGKRQHGAIDIVAPKGTPVAAAADGVVSVVANGGKNFSGYGKIVIVDHGSGVHTVYAHLDSYQVKIGQSVTRGQAIASVGRTGRVTTNLLHYEVRVDGKKIDPLTCMEERPGVVKMVNYRSPKKK